MSTDCQFAICAQDARTVLASEATVAEWGEVLGTHPHVNAMYASPVWVAHLASAGRAVHIWLVRDSRGRLVGVVPVLPREHTLAFSIGNRVLHRRRIRVAEILGSVLALPESEQVYQELIASIFSQLPDCDGIYLDALPTDTHSWGLWSKGRGLPGRCYLHVSSGPRPWHLVKLASSFDDYLGAMSSKHRANLKREIRQLGEAAGATLELQRVTDAASVSDFLSRAVRVSRSSWQHRVLGERVRDDEASRRSLEDLAGRGLLRSYILCAKERPCAFVIGHQFSGVYHYVEIGFDNDLSRYSPGSVLLFLILEDLHAYQRPETLNFGVGDAIYKRRFGNLERSDVLCLIMRRRIGNLLATHSHQLFNRAVKIGKLLIGRRVRK